MARTGVSVIVSFKRVTITCNREDAEKVKQKIKEEPPCFDVEIIVDDSITEPHICIDPDDCEMTFDEEKGGAHDR